MCVLEVLRVEHARSIPHRHLGFSPRVRDSADTFSRSLVSYDLLFAVKLADGHRSIFAFFLLLSVLLSWNPQPTIIKFLFVDAQSTAHLTAMVHGCTLEIHLSHSRAIASFRTRLLELSW